MTPTAKSNIPLGRPIRMVLLAATLALAASQALASLPDNRLPTPRAIAPVAGATVSEGEARFAWNAPEGATRHFVLLSRGPFETTGWTQLPDDPAVQVVETAKPIASLADLGITLDGDAHYYWAAGSGFQGSDIVSFGEVLPVKVLRKFTNRVSPSPHLVELGTRPIAASPKSGPYRIQLGAGFTIDPSQGDPVLPSGLSASASARASARTLLVSYGDADPEETRTRVLEAGGWVVSYVPDRAFLVRMPAARGLSAEGEAREAALAAAADWIGTYHPAYKLSPTLELENVLPAIADVLVFPDGDLAAVRQSIAALGGNVIASSSNGINKILRVSASGPNLQAFAQHEDVAWIEPYVRPEMFNGSAQWVVQTDVTNSRRVWDMGIQGEGQVIMTSDSGINMSHNQFRDAAVPMAAFGDYPTHRKVIAYKMGSSNPDVVFDDHGSFHGSHTAGSAAGNDAGNGTDIRDGMAKEAKLYHMDISGVALGTAVDPFLDLNDLFQPSYDGNAGGAARLSTNSWGAALAGAYNLNSLQVDQFMWEHKDYLIVIANGNSSTTGSVAAPATSKSCIGAGGTGNGASSNLLYVTTSRGPTADGRQKPTICSPGQAVSSSTSGSATYSSYSGTSMASPTATGAIALIRQYVTEGWYPTGTKVAGNAFEPSAALLKAMAVNSAANDVSGQTAPNNNVGYGRILADDVLYFSGDARRLLLVDNTAGLGHLETIEYQINVTDSAEPLEVALCWTDYPGNPVASIQLVNDFNLTVTNGVDSYKGNIYSGGFSVAGVGSYDNRDVEEAVRIQSPSTGLWTVRIEAVNVPLGPQPFGLCMTGGIGTTAGALALDRASYGSTSTVEIQVVDTNAGASVDVAISSSTEAGGETVTLPETGDGIYAGSIALSPFDGSMGDGTLQVSHGDVITATYIDAAPALLAQALSATASVTFATPIITNVGSTNQGSGAVLVTWDTDLNSTSQVDFGSTPTLGGQTTLDPVAALQHSVLVSGLTIGQTYFFDVESVALNGNVTRDDNGGNHYQFTVSPSADILIVYGGDVDVVRNERYVDALAANGWAYDLWNAGQDEAPPIGDLSVGLRSYKAVWWQVGLETYPPFSDAARDSITAYLDGGGRLAVTGHDIAWAFGDLTSSFYSPARALWLENTLHTIYVSDPAGWSNVGGVAADPISGAYTGTVSYTEHRAGASGDEIDLSSGSGTAVASWKSGDGSPDDAGLRWESGGPLGTPGSGYWGGDVTRLATMSFEWSGIQDGFHPTSAVRTDILDKTLIWLLGRDKPDVAVTAPNGAEVLTSNTVNIEWSETTYGGTNPATRKIEFSPDGGLSWNLVTAAAGASPYAWDLSVVNNTPLALLRVTLTDDGIPAFSSADASDATFTIQRPGGDGLGPVVVAGSIGSSPNPINNQNPATLTATISDLTTGGSNVVAAEWSFGAIAASPGTGNAMTGGFASASESVTANLTTANFSIGNQKLWVRGQDAAGNWGTANALALVVNGVQPLSVTGAPREFRLWQNVPNPVVRGTMIAYALPEAAAIELSIFDIQGRVLRRLVRGNVGPGIHQVAWDGADESGRTVGAGIYYYRITAGDRTMERRLVTLR